MTKEELEKLIRETYEAEVQRDIAKVLEAVGGCAEDEREEVVAFIRKQIDTPDAWADFREHHIGKAQRRDDFVRKYGRP